MTRLELPQRLDLKALPQLVREWPHGSTGVEIVLHPKQWVEPAGLVALACLIEASQRAGAAVTTDHSGCPAAGYWERMRFFSALGIASPEPSGPAREAEGRFSELKAIGDIFEVDEVTEGLVDVSQPTGEFRETHNHIVSEALNNVCQHSRACGFSQAQLYKATEVHFCIGDAGIGLREALRVFGPLDDLAAIEMALRVGVTSGSSRLGQRELRNRGVGLCAIERLVVGNGGRLVIWSGTGFYGSDGTRLANAPHWQGTLVAAALRRNYLAMNFRDAMKQLDNEQRALRKQP